MKILIVASEVKPFSVSGGLGDVMGALPEKVKKLGNDIRVISPMYSGVHKKYKEHLTLCGEFDVNFGHGNVSTQIFTMNFNGVMHYFIKHDFFFNRYELYGFNDDYNRFAFFSKATVDILKDIDFKPNVIHCNDWQTGLIPVYLDKFYKNEEFYKDIKVLFTIHNLQYQGIFERRLLEDISLDESYFNSDKLEYFGNINYLKAGIVYSDYLSTVSQRYAKEIQTEEYGFGLAGVMRTNRHKLTGIVNGIAYESNNPETDDIMINYNVDSIEKKHMGKKMLKQKLGLEENDLPLIVVISRLAYQKGVDLIPQNISELGAQLVVLGTGESRYEEKVKGIERDNNGQAKAIINYDSQIANELYAYGDLFLMPSLFEPCGLGQLYAMRYGTIPIVRSTGGLRDTVKHFSEENLEGTGIVFKDYLESAVVWAISEGVRLYNDSEKWNILIKNCMKQDFSWESSAKSYCELYEKVMDL